MLPAPSRILIATLATTAMALAIVPSFATAQEIRAEAEITVARVVVDAYVIDQGGNPIEGLRPMNFKAKIDGIDAEIESIEWVDSTVEYPESITPGETPEDPSIEIAPRGRLLVIFFQTDFQREAVRVKGQMKMRDFAHRFLDTLQPWDRVAVVSFDSHLKLRQDFTDDKDAIREAIDASIQINKVPPPRIGPSPSLFSRLKYEDARNAASSEKALFLIGNALLPIPGPKSLVMFGWGLGRYGAGGVSMTPDYSIARRALEASRTSVFALDVTEADFHSLEVGLGKVAKDTGGFYEKTWLFPKMAMEKLERVIQGHYVLVLKKPEALPKGFHKVEIVLKGKKGQVLARQSFDDR